MVCKFVPYVPCLGITKFVQMYYKKRWARKRAKADAKLHDCREHVFLRKSQWAQSQSEIASEFLWFFQFVNPFDIQTNILSCLNTLKLFLQKWGLVLSVPTHNFLSHLRHENMGVVVLPSKLSAVVVSREKVFSSIAGIFSSDGFELEFAEPSYKSSKPSRARHFNFRAETELSIFLCIAFLAKNYLFFLFFKNKSIIPYKIFWKCQKMSIFGFSSWREKLTSQAEQSWKPFSSSQARLKLITSIQYYKAILEGF